MADAATALAPNPVAGLPAGAERVLALQRSVGNAAVGRALAAARRAPARALQRVPREELRVGDRVRMRDMTVVMGDRIDPSARGVVTDVSGAGDVKVRFTRKETTDTEVAISASSLEHDAVGMSEALDVQRTAALKLVAANAALFGAAAKEIEASIAAPKLIDQGQFNFCGPNDLLMAIAMRDPVAYVNYLLDIYRAHDEVKRTRSLKAGGTAQLGGLAVPMDAAVVDADASTFDDARASQTDWMSMGSLRTATTAGTPKPKLDANLATVVGAFQTKGPASALKEAAKLGVSVPDAIMYIKKELAATPGRSLPELAMAPGLDDLKKVAEGAMPNEVGGWLRGYGAKDVIEDADTFSPTKTEADLRAANARLDVGRGRMVMLQIDADGLNGKEFTLTYTPTRGHWVLMKTPWVKRTEPAGDVWECQCWSWGAERTLRVAHARINEAYFGYVAATITTPS